MALREVCIVSMARTPMGSFGGAFKNLSAIQLGITATKEALERSKIPVEHVDDVYFGNVLSANLGQAPATQVALGAGILPKTPCTTINKVCASGMKAIEIGAMNISMGLSSVVVAGGFESMSNVPHYANKVRFEPKPKFSKKYGNVSSSSTKDANLKLSEIGDGQLIDGLAYDGLSDPYTDGQDKDAMGTFGVLAAMTNGITRRQQDEYTQRSYSAALNAAMSGKLSKEIVSVTDPEAAELDFDEEVKLRAKGMTFEKLQSLKSAFSLPKKYEKMTQAEFEKHFGVKFAGKDGKDFEEFKGSVTAGSASTMSDGAASLVLASKEYCDRNGVKYLCKIKSWGQAAQEPEKFTSSPAFAAKKALKMAGLDVKDINFWEVNEAFAVVPLLTAKQLGLNEAEWKKKLNIYGGACSMGHPLGMSGARITMATISALLNENGKYGLAAICNGGGGASAILLENHLHKPTSKL